MAGFGIQKRGTSKILVKRKGFSEGSYPLMEEVPEPKMERMPFDDDKDYTPKKESEYFTKETRVGKNQYKVEKVKKSDDEIGYLRELEKKKFDRRLKKAKGGQAKVGKVMREFGKGKLHSGKKGPVVKSRKQAIAIALSEAGMSKKKK